MSLLMLLVFVLLQTHQSVSRCQSCEQTSCDCSRQNLRQVPAAPSKPTVTELDLSFNRLKKIHKNDFVAYSSLRSLIINNNIIKVIQEQAFVPLTNLVKLDLSSNRLETLSAEWFKNLLSLQHLDLLGNKYKMLGQGNLFQPLKRLKTLHLGGPYLESVRKGDFSGLGALDKVIFEGKNLRAYAEGSLKEIGPIKHAELRLNGPFWRNRELVEAILSDVVHPNSTLTLTDTVFTTESQMSPFKVVNDGGTRRFILKNVNLTIGACIAVLNSLSDSNITMLGLEDTKFFLSHFSGFSDSPRMKHLHEIVWKNIDIPQFYRFPALFFLHPLLKEVRSVSVINCKLFAHPCEMSVGLSKVQYMDISGNILSDMSFSDLMCYGEGGLWSLRTFNISRNHLKSINSELFTKLDKLENIDMSMNVLQIMPETCYWPPRLKFLNLSSTHLRKVTACLP
ncbi:Toll-like receptor 2 type-2, partial [Nibea albiflora]